MATGRHHRLQHPLCPFRNVPPELLSWTSVMYLLAPKVHTNKSVLQQPVVGGAICTTMLAKYTRDASRVKCTCFIACTNQKLASM